MKRYIVFALALTFVVGAFAQDKMLSSKQLMTRSLYPHHPMRNIQFVGNSNLIAYIEDTVLYMGTPAAPKQCITLAGLNAVMQSAGEDELGALPSVTFTNDKEFTFNAGGKMFCYNTAKKTLTSQIEYGKGRENLQVAPGQGAYAYTDNNNLYIVHGKTTKSFTDQDPNIVYGQSVHRNEFGISKGIFWSPKGNRVAFYRMDQTMVTDYPKVNTSTRIATPEPFRYPMAGMLSHRVTLGVYDLATGKEQYMETIRGMKNSDREMYLTNITWSPDEKQIYIAKVNRDQNHMWLECYNAETGVRESVLFEEENSRYVEPCEGLYFVPNHPDQFLWFSMRDGYKHIYLYKTDGTLIKQLTHGEYEVEDLLSFDTKGENVFVYANKDNLVGRAAYRVNLKSGEMTLLTCAEGTHRVTVNPAGTAIIDIYSSLTVPAKCEVRNTKGKVLRELYNSPNPLQDYAMPTFELGTLKAADGKTDLYYRLITPPHMEQGKKYPTLVYVYGGPHSQLVTDDWLAGGNLYFTFLAQQGYIVFTLDNRGTDNRGFEFESCIHRQLGTLEMADQMEGVKFLQSLPCVDKDRMGVEGWSFGGFMTITMKLAHPEIFKVACAGGPVIDWKWYEVMYGERYMDTPKENPEGYANASLIDKAKNLEGRLLVIHGAEDNTVVWQNSIEFIEACIKAGKQVDYFIYPHHEHNVRGPERVHLYEKMFDYYETFLK